MVGKILVQCLLFLSLIDLAAKSVAEPEILAQAQKKNMPIIAIFLGDEWCPWSHRFSQEILSNACFSHLLEERVLLWQVVLNNDKPESGLLQKYRIEACPQVLLLDPKGREFARLNEIPLDALDYADKILSTIDAFQEICLVLGDQKAPFEESHWKELYLKAAALSIPYFSQALLAKGFKKEKGIFFHLEKLNSLLKKHRARNPKIVQIKKELLRRDPDYESGALFQAAILEFKKNAAHIKSKDRPEKGVGPLLSYIEQYGKKDAKHLWQAELMVAEFFFAKRQLSQALEYMGASYLAAPPSMQSPILEKMRAMENLSSSLPGSDLY